MSTPVTYVGNSYSVPAYGDSGYAQGAGNLSSYLVALATGNLTLSGGAFPLTADANFGANFGLVAIYYTSRTTTPATTGVLRLAKTDAVVWRNQLDSANLSLAIDSSNNLTFNGIVIGGGSAGDIGPLPAGKGVVFTTPDGLHTWRLRITNVDGDGNIEPIWEPLT